MSQLSQLAVEVKSIAERGCVKTNIALETLDGLGLR
jgi:hypothetical protein